MRTKIEKKLIAIAVILYPIFLNAQNGIEGAATKFTTVSTSLLSNIEKGLLALATICAAIGLVTALSKTNVEGEQASKGFIKWFVGAGFFSIAWGLMKTIFTA